MSWAVKETVPGVHMIKLLVPRAVVTLVTDWTMDTENSVRVAWIWTSVCVR